MKRRTVDRRIENGLGLVLMTMAVSAVGFVLAGSTDPRTQLVDRWCFTPERPYPWPAVGMSSLSVLAEGVLLWLMLARVRVSMVLRSLAGFVVAAVPAVGIDLALSAAANDRPRGYVRYHLLWLQSAAVLLLALFLVALSTVACRRLLSRGAPPGHRRTVEGPASAAGQE